MADDRMVEIMSEMLFEFRNLTRVTEAMAADIRDIKQDIHDVKQEITELKIQQGKTNLALNELRLSNMKLAERIEDIVQLDQRVRVLENIVLPKAS